MEEQCHCGAIQHPKLGDGRWPRRAPNTRELEDFPLSALIALHSGARKDRAMAVKCKASSKWYGFREQEKAEVCESSGSPSNWKAPSVPPDTLENKERTNCCKHFNIFGWLAPRLWGSTEVRSWFRKVTPSDSHINSSIKGCRNRTGSSQSLRCYFSTLAGWITKTKEGRSHSVELEDTSCTHHRPFLDALGQVPPAWHSDSFCVLEVMGPSSTTQGWQEAPSEIMDVKCPWVSFSLDFLESVFGKKYTKMLFQVFSECRGYEFIVFLLYVYMYLWFFYNQYILLLWWMNFYDE